MRTFWKRYVALLENDLSAQIFDNVKNLLVCALLFAAGTNTMYRLSANGPDTREGTPSG